jgi:ankyrin repeat protein
MKLLVENGLDLNKLDIYGATPLTWAIRCNDTDMVNFIMDLKIGIKTEDYEKLKHESEYYNKQYKEESRKRVRSDAYSSELKHDLSVMKRSRDTFKQDVSCLKQDKTTLRREITTLKNEVTILKKENTTLRERVKKLKDLQKKN